LKLIQLFVIRTKFKSTEKKKGKNKRNQFENMNKIHFYVSV